ncbi:MAG: thioredoxin-disulfide reductase [Treponema sp.]|nr:thioredoxin-disulfide reductase [Treponema sp.]MBR4464647.1 thioredoxin-disulfide reductase [Treponema sp.]
MLKKTDFDFIVIGAGAAGLTAAQYGARSGLDTMVIDLSDAGGQALNIFTLENYPGVFPPVPGRDFIKNMEKQAKSFGAKIIHSKVSSIDKIGQQFVVRTLDGELKSYAILIATGAQHRALGVDGEKKLLGKGVSYCATCDGPFFKGKKIMVVGGGDSACSEAFYLATLSNSVTLIHRRKQLRAQKAVAEKILAHPNITVRYNSVVKKINGKDKVESVVLSNVETNEEVELPTDAVFIFIGMNPRTDLVSMLPKDESGYLITNYRMETLIPGMYAAGDVRAKPFRQIITASSDGAIAAHQAHEYVNTLKTKMTVQAGAAAQTGATK